MAFGLNESGHHFKFIIETDTTKHIAFVEHFFSRLNQKYISHLKMQKKRETNSWYKKKA